LALPPGRIARIVALVRRGDVLLRIGLCLTAALIMWGVTGAWAPPFSYRTGEVPPRNIVARASFRVQDEARTEARRQRARGEIVCTYQHDVQPLVELRQALTDRMFQLVRAPSFEELDEGVRADLLDRPNASDAAAAQKDFDAVRAALAGDMELDRFGQAVQRAMGEFERDGLLEKLQHHLEEGSQRSILVHPVDKPETTSRVEVSYVHIAEASNRLDQRLVDEFRAAGVPAEQVPALAGVVQRWLKPRLPTTLTLDEAATKAAQEAAMAKVEPETFVFAPGEVLAKGGKRLTATELDLLAREHEALVSGMSADQLISRCLADLGMFIALYVLCGFYIFFRERKLLDNVRQLATLLGLAVVTVSLSWAASGDNWRAEMVPLLLFAMTLAIAYQRELALLLSSSAALVIALSLGQGLTELVILVASCAAAVQLLDRIRSRTKLIYVGLWTGVVAFLTTLGTGVLAGEAFGTTIGPAGVSESVDLVWESYSLTLLSQAAWYAFCAVIASLLMTGLLPFIERLFDVQTDISLLELGDPSHPLMQELVRRAPGTYNHSINVASISEAAAEAIGANGLLVRVGAYFHDIGKMLKPGYFIENQGSGVSRHQTLMPAMSTLVIIAHVKDGADLARQHHLPRSIIDFIEQHHGTTLVEYFYNEAAKQRQATEEGGTPEEADFRYPGPKPQTKEAGVLMLADAVESASRVLVDPAPARIESLVHEIAMKRLLDGQFEECGLTLQEMHTVEESLIKSLTAVYHGRVKYPSQQTA
jgi:hypothetical protein